MSVEMRLSMSPQVADVLVREVMPIIQGTVPYTARPVGCEDVQELVQDALMMAIMMLEALEAAGKTVIGKSVAYYAVQRIKSGRRSYGGGRMDVLSPAAQLDRHCVLVSFDQPVEHHEDAEGMTFGDSLAGAHDDPGAVAARRIDWRELDRQLSSRESDVLRGLVQGHGTGELAKKLHVSAPRVTQLKREIAENIREMWGNDVLADVGQQPQWMYTLQALRGV